MQNEFPSNSHTNQAPKKEAPAAKPKVTKVVSGEVIRRKKPLGKKFTDLFVGGDARGVMSYVALDVLLPAAKDAVADAVSQGIEKMLFGETRSSARRRPGSSSPFGNVSYHRMATPHRDDRPRISNRGKASHDFDEIILATKAEANEVIDRLFDLVSQYEAATVSDLYDMLDISPSYVDRSWGWTDIRGAGVTHVRDGYLLDLPRPIPLDR